MRTIKKYAALRALRNERKVIKNWKECSINCAGMYKQYFILFRIRKSYQQHAAVYYCGGHVGIKNYSARFPYPFYHMYMLIDLTLKICSFR